MESLTEKSCMTGKCFVDTNIVGYLLSTDIAKHSKAKAILDNTPTISAQVLNEFVNICLKKARMGLAEAHRLAETLISNTDVVAVELDTVKQAMKLAAQYQYSHWDSLIIAAALQLDCSVLYSEDMQQNQLIENKLRIINPFLN